MRWIGLSLLLIMPVLACQPGEREAPLGSSVDPVVTAASVNPQSGYPAPPATPQPTARPLVKVVPPPPPPTSVGSIDARPFFVGPPIPLPEHVALLMEGGCWACEGPPHYLFRVYRETTGAIRAEQIFTAAYNAPVSSFLGFEHPLHIIGTCGYGDCASLGLSLVPSSTVLIESTDGGVSWSKYATYPENSGLVTLSPSGPITYLWTLRSGGFGETAYFRNGVTLTHPPPVPGHSVPSPFIAGADRLLWLTRDQQLKWSDGSWVTDLPVVRGVLGPGPANDELVVRWATTNFGEPTYLSIVGLDGTVRQTHLLPPAAGSVDLHSFNHWLSPTSAIVLATFTRDQLGMSGPNDRRRPLPAVLDLASHSLRPVTDPFLAGTPSFAGLKSILAVQTGPFSRVVDTGSCLNVRERPGLGSAVHACVADNVLLHDFGLRATADEQSWRQVETPAGQRGWVSDRYLGK